MTNIFWIEQNINEYVKGYSERIVKDPAFYESDEGYKYQAVSTFQKEFDLDAKDFKTMIIGSLASGRNLIQSGQYFPKRMLLLFVEKDPGYVRKLFRDLLLSGDSVGSRIDRFIEGIKKRFSKLLDNDRQTYIDCRFLSFFLAAYKPEDYFYVKALEFKKFSKMVAYDLPLEGSQGNRYEALFQLASVTRSILSQNQDFKKAHEIIVKKFSYKDSSLSWGTFDFIFNVARRMGAEIKAQAEKKIAWRSKIISSKDQSAEDFLAEEDVEQEMQAKSKADILTEAIKFHPKNSSYIQKEGSYKLRLDNARQKVRVKILEDYVCQVCGFSFEYINSNGEKKKYAEADHIIEKSEGGTEELDNLWVLCPNCHVKKSLGVIRIDPVKKEVTQNERPVKIRDNHLNWQN